MAQNNHDYEVNLDEYPAFENGGEIQDDIFDNQEGSIQQQDQSTPDNFLNEDGENSVINMLLNQKGIIDPTQIQFENEDGEIETVDFNSLSRDEQLAILAEKEDNSPEISNNEIEVINFMRENNVTFEEILQFERQKAIDDYINSNTEQTYTVDDLTNEDLYRFDLQTRYPNLTEEELDVELVKELQSPDLFEKKANTLRDEYKGLEETQNSELLVEKQQQDEQTYNNLVNTMVGIAESTNDLYSLDLEDSDKEEVLSFLLDRDINGQSQFAKLLNNPEELFKLAWFAIKGEEAFDVTHDYYKKEIDAVRKKGSIQPTRTVIKKSEGSTEDAYGIWDKK